MSFSPSTGLYQNVLDFLPYAWIINSTWFDLRLQLKYHADPTDLGNKPVIVYTGLYNTSNSASQQGMRNPSMAKSLMGPL